jgi:rRNA maturation protein Nop10
MEQNVSTHCRNCGERQPHEIYLGSNGYVHSMCTVCGKDVVGATPVDEVTGGSVRACAREKADRYHVKYLGKSAYVHWFCATCGKDVRSASPVRSG